MSRHRGAARAKHPVGPGAGLSSVSGIGDGAARERPAQRLGERLVQGGHLSADQRDIALAEQRRTRERLGRVLCRLGFTSECQVVDTLCELLGQERALIDQTGADLDAVSLIPPATARRLRVVPLTLDVSRQCLTLAMDDTHDVPALDAVGALLGPDMLLHPVLATSSELDRALDQAYGHELALDGVVCTLEASGALADKTARDAEALDPPIVRLCDALLRDAVGQGASDLHIEPDAGYLRFRYRVDGVLRTVRSLHCDFWPPVAVRFKIMAGLDIAETRLPQDGRFTLPLAGRTIDCRVSTMPTVHGENIVVRLLDRLKGIMPLHALGLEQQALTSLRTLALSPAGLLLVTGPTGSGKTTTLYSLLHDLDREALNVMTLEDPVEYVLDMVRQTAVREGSGPGFADGVRALLRQAPDVILIGEIRDQETARMALRAAMTGHRVFSSLHAPSSFGVLPRLADMGVSAALLAEHLVGVVAQRLLRRLRLECTERYRPAAAECRLLGVDAAAPPTLLRVNAAGRRAEHRGYLGRVPVVEVLRCGRQLAALIAAGEAVKELMQAAAADDFRGLAEAAAALVLAGVTSFEEASRQVDFSRGIA
jgi:type II secretory ATPase GspE/PulE/Tfp pilus assembly ATPase PilB-like protein